MGSGLDLARLIPSVLFGFFILAALSLGFVDMGRISGISLSNTTFGFNHTLDAGLRIEKKISEKGTDQGVAASFFPAIGTLFDVWGIVKDSTTGVIKDMTQMGEKFFEMIGEAGGGSTLLFTLKTIFIVVILVSIAWIVLAALFRQPGWKQQ